MKTNNANYISSTDNPNETSIWQNDSYNVFNNPNYKSDSAHYNPNRSADSHFNAHILLIFNSYDVYV